MIKTFTQKAFAFFMLTLVLSIQVMAQQTSVSGSVTDGSGPLIGVNIIVKGKVVGTISDTRGNFKLNVSSPPPLTLVFSIVGYESQEIEIKEASVSGLTVALKESVVMGQEVVVSATRVEESILESPVSIEKMDIVAIREAAAPSFYDALNNLKGVEMSTQSLTFKSFNTRGFNANGNVRTVQMIDGMDNQAPGLNFSVGNIVGISELDLESAELLPGAASALYGPNAINGILLMTSKNPFQYQGLSANLKTGIMSEGQRPTASSPFYDFSARYAKAINDKVAFKINVAHLQAEDWQANDFRDMSLLNGSSLGTGTRANNPGYNGVNTYGDETNVNMQSVAQSMIAAGALPQSALAIIPNTAISRTGWQERDLADYNTKSTKISGALHWRLNDKVEAILQGNYGTGTTVYTGADRYSIANFKLGQYKAELRASNWYLRAYTTQERSGDAYAVGILGQGLNEAYNPSTTWFPEYVGAYAQAFAATGNAASAHNAARAFADRNRFEVGSAAFNSAADAIKNRPIPGNAQGVGARFVDKTNLYHLEGMYNFSEVIDFAEIIVGANYRQYALNSDKTLFATDNDGNEFSITEYGGYVQASKKLLSDALKLSASARYDKNENFEGQWSPRASAVYTFANTNNIRFSYQTGFRIPTTQDQYIDLNTPQARLIGGLPLFRDRYNMNTNPVYSLQSVTAYGTAIQQGVAAALGPNGTGNPSNPLFNAAVQQATQLITQAVTTQVTNNVQAQVAAGNIPNDPAVIAAAISTGVAQTLPTAIPQQLPQVLPQVLPVVVGTANRSLLQPYQFQQWQPERVRVIEVGYKTLIANKLMVDAYYYQNTFEVFSGSQILVQDRNFNPGTPQTDLGLNLLSANTRFVYSMPVSNRDNIKSSGWAIGLDYALPKGYRLGGNLSSNRLSDSQEAGLITSFNTPEYRYNISLANREFVKNLGFNFVYRWQDSFVWNSSIVSPALNNAGLAEIPAFGTFDAQFSYKMKSWKSIIKLGGSNLFGNDGYTQAFANPTVGKMYYLSITFDEFLN